MIDPTLISLRSTREFLAVCDRLLARGHAVRFRADGWSMYPTIRDGDTVEVTRVEALEVRRGDVLLCRLGSASVAHRVIAINRTGTQVSSLVLRGDAAFSDDAPVATADILGRVTAVTHNGSERRLDTTIARMRDSLFARAFRAKRWLRSAILPAGSRTWSAGRPW